MQYKKIDDNYIIEIRCIKLNTYIEGDIEYFTKYFKYFRIIVDRSFEFYHTNILMTRLRLNPKVLNKETYILNSGYYILESRKE